MGILQVELFGGVRVTHNNWLTEVSITREIQSLLAYLLLQRHRVHSREVLAGIFWAEQPQEKARGSLNTALWKLKRALEPDGVPSGTYLKTMQPGEVGFNKESPHWLDIEVFEEKINEILTKPFQTAEGTLLVDLEKVLGLYKGELLEGCYKDWALRERERLRALYLKSLIYLLQYHGSHKAYEKAITYGQKILDLNPLREEIHRELMRLYLESGQRALAVRQYEICRLTLAKEMGIAPMEDTQELYTQMLSRGGRHESAIISKGPAGFDQALRQLREASQTIDLAKEQIQQAFRMIARFSEHPDQMSPSKAKEINKLANQKQK
ncbi:MAG TPA: BTAD domain-containing putative transcriptional regulator [Anaerolineales bacterium]|nr:BTAD domain-containing putative transcriptional regulator [Anaerolineales bacterium]